MQTWQSWLYLFFYSLVSGGLEKTPFNGAVVFTALPLNEEGLFISYGIQNARHVPILNTQRPDHLILVGQVACNISLNLMERLCLSRRPITTLR